MTSKFLEGYSGQSTAELIGMADQYRIDSLVLAFEEALDGKPRSDLTQAERTILAVEALEREVNNGGYSQFFINSSVEYAPDIVAALERIGCPETADITARAINSLRLDQAVTAEAAERSMEKDDSERDDKLHECDSAYYDGSEAIADRLFAFIQEHKAQIRLP